MVFCFKVIKSRKSIVNCVKEIKKQLLLVYIKWKVFTADRVHYYYNPYFD